METALAHGNSFGTWKQLWHMETALTFTLEVEKAN